MASGVLPPGDCQNFAVALRSDQRGQVAQWTQRPDPTVLVARLSKFRDQVAWVMYEAGPTGFGLVRALRAAGFKADVIATSLMPTTVSRDAKSDRLNCRQLAEHAGKQLFRVIRLSTQAEPGAQR